jgi:hypothetical protein
MTIARTSNLVAAGLVGLLFAATVQAQTVETPIGKLDFELGVPTQETVTKLYDTMDFQRACQLYLWALPIHRRRCQFAGHTARHHWRSSR